MIFISQRTEKTPESLPKSQNETESEPETIVLTEDLIKLIGEDEIRNMNFFKRFPTPLERLTSTFAQKINSRRKKIFLCTIGPGNTKRDEHAIVHDMWITTKTVTKAIATYPYVNQLTGAWTYYTIPTCPHTVKICEESIAYYNSLDALRGLVSKEMIDKDGNMKKIYEPDVIPEIFKRANEYGAIEEIIKAKKMQKKDLFMILMVLFAGMGIGYIAATILNPPGDSYDIGGNYTENNNPDDTNNNNNNNNNGGNNGNPVVIP